MKKIKLEETFFNSNLKFLIKNISNFCSINEIKIRTFQDVYYKKVKNPRIDTIIEIASALNISIDDLIYKDLTKENN